MSKTGCNKDLLKFYRLTILSIKFMVLIITYYNLVDQEDNGPKNVGTISLN